jgi:uncharacterized RDD family membrane protein YckC
MYCQFCGANVAEGAAFCTSCGRPMVGYTVGQSSPPGGVAGAPGVVPVSLANRSYAGFWLRFVASFIDGLVLVIPMGIVGFLAFASAIPVIARNRGDRTLIMATLLPHIVALLVLLIVGSWLYWGLLESSVWQATLGKKALGLYVTDLAGNRATFGRATGRFFAGRGIGSIPYLGGLYYLVDCLCAGLTDRKQAIHDMIAGCLVVRRS